MANPNLVSLGARRKVSDLADFYKPTGEPTDLLKSKREEIISKIATSRKSLFAPWKEFDVAESTFAILLKPYSRAAKDLDPEELDAVPQVIKVNH